MSTTTSNTGTLQRPNQVCNGNLPASQQTIKRFYDTSCFVAPPLYTFGNAGRNIIIGPGYEDWDFGLTARDRIQIATPPSHILGLLNIMTALQTGVWMRLHRRFDVDRMLQHIQDDRITIEMAVAPIALAIASNPHLESYDLSSLRFIMWGATPVSASVAETVTRRTGVGWVPAYGTTELPVIACNDCTRCASSIG